MSGSCLKSYVGTNSLDVALEGHSGYAARERPRTYVVRTICNCAETPSCAE